MDACNRGHTGCTGDIVMTHVRVHDCQGDLVLVDATRASTAERAAALPRAEASHRLDACSDSLDNETLAQVYELAFDHALTGIRTIPARNVIVRRLVEAAESGRLLVSASMGCSTSTRPTRTSGPG